MDTITTDQLIDLLRERHARAGVALNRLGSALMTNCIACAEVIANAAEEAPDVAVCEYKPGRYAVVLLHGEPRRLAHCIHPAPRGWMDAMSLQMLVWRLIDERVIPDVRAPEEFPSYDAYLNSWDFAIRYPREQWLEQLAARELFQAGPTTTLPRPTDGTWWPIVTIGRTPFVLSPGSPLREGYATGFALPSDAVLRHYWNGDFETTAVGAYVTVVSDEHGVVRCEGHADDIRLATVGVGLTYRRDEELEEMAAESLARGGMPVAP